MPHRTRRPTADTMRFCDTCSQDSTGADRAERHYQDHRSTPLTRLGALR